MRLSQANEDSQRASNHQPSSSERSQATLCLKKRFPKSARIRTRAEFKRVHREGKRIVGRFLVFHHVSKQFTNPRLGITVSKQFGSAVTRNLFKRRVREAFRSLQHSLPPSLDFHVSPRHGASLPSFQQTLDDFLRLSQLPL